MSQATTTTKPSLEDTLLFLGVVLGAASTFFTNYQTTIFGMSPFILAVVAAALAKALPSLAVNPKSLEDWILFLAAFLGALSTAFSANPAYVTWGIIAGFLLKAVLSFKGATSQTALEDSLLAISIIIAGVGQIMGNAQAVDLALFLATVSKSLPSISLATSQAPPKA